MIAWEGWLLKWRAKKVKVWVGEFGSHHLVVEVPSWSLARGKRLGVWKRGGRRRGVRFRRDGRVRVVVVGTTSSG